MRADGDIKSVAIGGSLPAWQWFISLAAGWFWRVKTYAKLYGN